MITGTKVYSTFSHPDVDAVLDLLRARGIPCNPPTLRQILRLDRHPSSPFSPTRDVDATAEVALVFHVRLS